MSAYLHCPLCGFEFEKRTTACANGCPLGKFCHLIACPNCHYEFPEKSQTLGWLQRLFHWHRKPAARAEHISLTDLEVGETSELVCINCTHNSRRNALAIYGLVPGGRIFLQQKRPAFVVRIGETELALEASIAREIMVKPLPA